MSSLEQIPSAAVSVLENQRRGKRKFMSKNVVSVMSLALGSLLVLGVGVARADDEDRPNPCGSVPSHAAVRMALEQARAQANGGFNLEMWATVVNRDGIVCVV